MLWEVTRYFQHGWIGRYYVGKKFHFTFYGFEWVRPWPGEWMYVHFAVLGILAACIMAGLFYHVCTLLFFVGFTYVFLLDQTQYLNHFYFVSLMTGLLVFVPANRAMSLDVRRKPRIRSDTAPAWTLLILRAQIGIVYFYAGIAKITPDWLRGEPMRTWLAQRQGSTLLGPLLPVGRLFTQEWVVYLFCYGGLLLDLAVVPLLIWRRTRVAAFILLVLFHLTNAWLFNIGIFPWFAMAATLLFFEPRWPRRIFNWPRKWAAHVQQWRTTSAGVIRPLGIAFFLLFFAIQILVPLRHFLYASNVHWSEEGHRFSWHMKLRDKRAHAVFQVTDPASGKSWIIHPSRYLTRRQAAKMAARPDMILQFAHFLAERMRAEGRGNVEVRARAEASLNGRPMQLLIDPTVDLAAQPRNLRRAGWIMPLVGSEPTSQRSDEGMEEPDEPVE